MTLWPAALHRILTAFALAAAAAGLVLPLLPTTPFLLLAAWSAARHSPALEARIARHPHVGPHLRAWREQRALSRNARRAALVSMGAGLALTLWMVDPVWAKVLAALVVAAVALFIGTRPEPTEGSPGPPGHSSRTTCG